MFICNGTTFWGYLFKFFEIIIIIFLGYIFTKNIVSIKINNELQKYENIDILILSLSILQIYIMLVSIGFSNNYGLSIIQEIFKFTQNFLIAGCLFLQIILWQKNSFAVYFVKNFIVFLLIFISIIMITSLIFEYTFSEIDFCLSLILRILPIISLFLNVVIVSITIYNKYREQNEQSREAEFLIQNDNLNNIIHKFKSSLQKSRKYYLIFILSFTLSIMVDIFFKFSYVNLNKISNDKSKEIKINSLRLTDFYSKNEPKNITSYYIYFEKNKTYNRKFDNFFVFNKKEENKTSNEFYSINACIYYKNLGENYSFRELIICFIYFFFKDIGPHVYIYISLFKYKQENASRTSSFIEI